MIMRFLVLILAIFTLAGCVGSGNMRADSAWWAENGQQVNEPAPLYSDVELYSRYVTMRDGVRLAVDV